jgi:hypothetical protein
MKIRAVFIAICAVISSYSCVTTSRSVLNDSQDITILSKPAPVAKQEKVANGQCTAVVTYNNKGEIDNVSSPDCEVGQKILYITSDKRTFYELKHSSESITFGGATTTCYGPPYPSPPRCVCTAQPCP